MSIRLRLTLLYSGILAATLTAFSVIVYLTLAHSTHDMMQDTLALEMQRLMAHEKVQPRPAYVSWPVNRIGAGDNYWQMCDEKGKVLDRTDNLQDHYLPLSETGLQQVQSGEAIYEVTRVNDMPLMVFSQPIQSEGIVTGILQVARDFADQEQALQLLQTALIGGSLGILLLAVGSGWFISGAALKPVGQLTRTASMIKEERNFERRVHYEGPPDEIGQLAITFNAMLAALQAAYQQVAEALEAQRWFVADASHELRTPLTTLRGNLALLRRDPPISDEDRHAVLTDIVDENERMIRLVNDLLTLARTDSVPHLETTSVPLQPLLVEVERQITALHPSEHFVLDCPTGVTVSGHRDALKQVLLILLDNAFKFTATEGKVRLSAKSQGNQVSIQVEDTGIGIEKTELPRIFRRFYRGDFARNGSGYGLGLPIAKALMEKQQGRISVESIVNSGSTFTVWLQKA